MFKIYIVFVIKSNTSNKNANQTLNQLNTAIEQLGGNPNFPTINPALPLLVAKKEALAQAILKAEGKDRNRVAALKVIVKEAKQMLVALSADINVQSNGDLAKALTSGFPQRTTPTSEGLLPAAGNVRAVALGDGKIKLMWGAVKGKKLYNVSSTMDLDAQPVWVECGNPTRNSLIIEGLTPGVMYYFRVAARNSFGMGIHSDVVAIRCV